jgi:hypothetical protein
MKLRPGSIHPLIVLALALTASAAFGLFAYRVVGIRDVGFLLYVTLVGVPFIAFAHDRLVRWPRGPGRPGVPPGRRWRRSQLALDAPVIGLALLRGLGLIPVISGHAMFLAYALWTSRAPLVRWTALAVLAQVAYVKGFGADQTLWWGLLAGSIAGAVHRRLGDPPAAPDHSSG